MVSWQRIFIVAEERHNKGEVRRYLTEARKLALEEKDYISLWNAYNYEGWAHGFNCEFAKGESSFLRLIEMSKEAGTVIGLVATKCNIVMAIYGYTGRIEEGLRYSQEALQLALQVDDIYLKGYAYGACSIAFFRKGMFPEAGENLRLTIEMSQKTDFAGVLLGGFFGLGLLHSEMGRYREAQKCYDDLLVVYERVRIWPSRARLAQIQKVAAGVRGRLNPALDAMHNFDLQEIRNKTMQGQAASTIGEIYLFNDDDHMDEAEAWIKKAIEIDEQNQMPWDQARDYALYSEFFKKKGDSAQAKEKLDKAIELMGGCGADGWVQRYEEELAKL